MLIVMGKSCSGKDTLIKELVNRGWHKVVTFTTRPKRDNEKDGVDYHFISESKFQDMINKKQFVEYKSYNTKFGTWYYGIAVSDMQMAGDHDIACLTPAGVLDAKVNPYVRDIPKHVLYVYASDNTILSRLKARGDDEEEAARRFLADKEDFRLITCISYKAVWNDNVPIQEIADEVEKWYAKKLSTSISD